MIGKIKDAIGYRPTWAEVSLGAIAHNFREVKKRLARNVLVMATVKADAYGHGLIPVAKKLAASGTDYGGGASIDEGIILRNNGINKPVLILGMVLPEDVAPLFRYDLTPSVCTHELARALEKKAAALRRIFPVHVKVDTGMARLGVRHQDAFDFVKQVSSNRHLQIKGIFTHFAFADLNPHFTMQQTGIFSRLVKRLASCGLEIPLVHAANSAGIFGFSSAHFSLVRPGLVLYGLTPAKTMHLSLKPALSLKTKVVFAKDLPAGSGVSYGHIYKTKHKSRIVTLPIGYGDGYPRNLSNIAPVLINGSRFTVSGRVCMDQIMVDVGNSAVGVGDEVVLIGRQGKELIRTEELADLAGTISYEIVCGLGSRVPRVYI